ncbi:hypothetical protein ACFVGY_06425 [Streptomyces sp. NPDC127106]|uniref:hypothetical protein n=1 Tax=Streptomyces sp. NPDC127106 TaxID=3345360 RepID=UPI00363BA3FC
MSMPPPQQSPGPGPYGPPQSPHPYGGPHYAPQSFQPQYPAQPQPHPGQAAWGQPPVGPPQRTSRPWMVFGIIAASIAAASVIKVATDVSSRTSGVGFPKAEYRLTVPKTLVGGTFELAQDLSQSQGEEGLKGTYSSKVRNPRPAVGQYTSGDPARSSVLVLSGMYGQFKDPAEARRKTLAGAADAEGATLAVPARDVTPTGSGITLSCQVLTYQDGGATSTLPMCAWGDENTSAGVALATPETARQAPGSVDLDKLAEITLKVRAEARQPIG